MARKAPSLSRVHNDTAGNEVASGSPAPAFTLHYFEGGLKTISNSDLAGKPTILSVVPSLDTGVCAIQTKKFNQDWVRWAIRSMRSPLVAICPLLRIVFAVPKM